MAELLCGSIRRYVRRATWADGAISDIASDIACSVPSVYGYSARFGGCFEAAMRGNGVQ